MNELAHAIQVGYCNGYFRHIHLFHTGSRVTCDPPVFDTDTDVLLLVNDLNGAGCAFSYLGWTNCFEDWLTKGDTDPAKAADDGYSVEIEGGARFQAWRKGEENVIVTDDQALHVRSVAATYMAKALNLQSKQDRISLFRAIKYGEELNAATLSALKVEDTP